VHTVAAVLLTGLLTLCPILCGAEEFGHGARLHDANEPASAPGHCPAEGDNCICQGAVASDDVRIPDDHASCKSLLLTAFAHTPLYPGAIRTPAGSPASRAVPRGARSARSLLQNFRC
jgi:hypothetical protein